MAILRIVRMVFDPARLSEFHEVFDANKVQIGNFPGCLHLELHGDLKDERVRYTHSLWQSEEDLETYRQSDLFRGAWAISKTLFVEKPQAFSLVKREEIERVVKS